MIVKIAEEILDFTPAHVDFFEMRMKEYIVEDEPASCWGEPGMTMTVCFAPRIEAGTGALIQSIDGNGVKSERFEAEDRGFDFEIVNYSVQGDAISKIYYRKDYSKVKILLNERFRPKGITLCDYEYLLTGIWFAYFISQKEGMMFHSSAISYKGHGVLFSGDSGAGKSTHAGLWEKFYANDVNVINDDKPIVKMVDGEAWIFGTPWSGKTDKNSNISAKLESIFFVVQSKDNFVTKMPQREAIANLIKQVYKPYHDVSLLEHNLALIDQILRGKSVYALNCDISRDAVECVREVLAF